MEQAVIPFLLYILLQGVVFLAGAALVRPEASSTGILRTYVSGQMMVFAVLELLAVPMILFHIPFHTLFWSFCGCTGGLALAGGFRWLLKRKTEKKLPGENKEPFSPVARVLLLLAVLVILSQFFIYLFGTHLDEDDSRWLAQANDSLVYGDMIYRDYSTGENWTWIHMPKDAVSPWPMFFAILSRLTLNTRVTVLAHTVFAPAELLVMYGIYYLLGCELFRKRESRYMFLLAVAFINFFYAGTVYTQSVFSLVRIWQGKAVVAAIIIPLLLYLFVRINGRNQVLDWWLLLIADIAACLVSGMGISIAAIMIVIYGLYHIIAYRSWKRIPLLFAGVIPSLVFALLYMNYNRIAEYLLLGKK